MGRVEDRSVRPQPTDAKDFGRVEPKAMWEDLKAAGMLTDMDKVAVVTDTGWVEKLSGLAGVVAPVTIKVFSTDERPAALSWLAS